MKWCQVRGLPDPAVPALQSPILPLTPPGNSAYSSYNENNSNLDADAARGDSHFEGDEIELNTTELLLYLWHAAKKPLKTLSRSMYLVKGGKKVEYQDWRTTNLQITKVPVCWVPKPVAEGTPACNEVDNPGDWDELTFIPKYKKKGKYLHHMLPTSAMPVPLDLRTGRQIKDGWEFCYDGSWAQDESEFLGPFHPCADVSGACKSSLDGKKLI